MLVSVWFSVGKYIYSIHVLSQVHMYLGKDQTSYECMHWKNQGRASVPTIQNLAHQQVFRDLKWRKVSCSQFWCLGFSYSGNIMLLVIGEYLHFCRCLKTQCLEICKVLLRILLVLVSRYAFMLGRVVPAGPEGFNNLRPIVMDMMDWNSFRVEMEDTPKSTTFLRIILHRDLPPTRFI